MVSFMSIEMDVQGIRDDLGIHHIVVNDWDRGVDADQNVVLISVPSVLSPNLAPPGKHILHAYTPGTEPFEIWEGLDRRSNEYKNLKAERSEVLLVLLFIDDKQWSGFIIYKILR